MAILGAILGAMGVIGIILWRLNQAAEATKGLADTAQDLANLGRRWSWRRKANVDPLTLVDDQRVAAVTMMVAVAQADGALTAAERDIILKLSSEKFGCPAKTAEEMLSYGRFLIGNSREPGNAFRKLLPLIQKTCGRHERDDIVDMLRAVASADGHAATAEMQAIERLARDLA